MPPLCTSGTLQITVSVLYDHRLFALPYLHKQPTALRALFMPSPLIQGINFCYFKKHDTLPTAAAMITFFTNPCLYIYYLLHCGLFSTFTCGICYASLQVISGVLRMTQYLPNCICGMRGA